MTLRSEKELHDAVGGVLAVCACQLDDLVDDLVKARRVDDVAASRLRSLYHEWRARSVEERHRIAELATHAAEAAA